MFINIQEILQKNSSFKRSSTAQIILNLNNLNNFSYRMNAGIYQDFMYKLIKNLANSMVLDWKIINKPHCKN